MQAALADTMDPQPPAALEPASARKRMRLTPPAIVLQPALGKAGPSQQGAQTPITLGATDLAASQRELQEKQRDALAELHALYKNEYTTLTKVLSALKEVTDKQNKRAEPAAGNKGAAAEAPAPAAPQPPVQQPLPSALPAPQPSHGPRPGMSVAHSADTSAGKAVASFNNWVGTAAPSGGTPQSLYRSERAHAATHAAGSQSDLPTSAQATTAAEPAVPPAKEPPTTPARTPAADTDTPMVSTEVSPQPAVKLFTNDADTPAATDAHAPATAQDTALQPTNQPPEEKETPVQPQAEEQQAASDAPAQPEAVINVTQTPSSLKTLRHQPPTTDADMTEAPQRVEVPESVRAELLAMAARQRFGSEAIAKQVLQLEGLASAITEQELDTLDALACLVGRKGRYLVRQSTVLLGRSTDTKGEVDVELTEEDASHQVSRRQAYLVLQPDGCWAVTNAGRKPMRVDGRGLDQFEVARVQQGSLLEVGDVQLMFMVNTGAVQRVLRRMQRAAG